jgi:anaerobic selenocysteine-containing dehydrogenase
MNERDWVERMFLASDLPSVISWRKFLKKGYYVVPAPDEGARSKRAFDWFYKGRKKDTPEPHPLPAEHTGAFREGLQTRSRKFEFESQSLKALDPNDAERPPILKYVPSWEGHKSPNAQRFPFQLITPHPRFSFHTEADGKNSFMNAIAEHRMVVDGYAYRTLRINTTDAQERGIRKGDLVRVFNERGSVICAALPTARLPRGILHGYESSAEYSPVGTPDQKVERGGCFNTLTSKRPQITKSHSLAASACLVELEKWSPPSARSQRELVEEAVL